MVRTVVILFMLLSSLNAAASASSSIDWVKAEDRGLSAGGRPFRFIGANTVNFVFYDDWDLNLEEAIRSAKENNISVLRVYLNWGWGKGEDYDRIIDIAARYGIYVTLALTDCCCSGDYPDLDKYFASHAPFCNITNARSVTAFKKFIKDTIYRKNSINGRLYRDDPAIIAWEIANELEYWRFPDNEVKKWIDNIAGYIKSHDKNHLVSVGIATNKIEQGGGDRVYGMFNSPAVDFLSFHFYSGSTGSGSNERSLERDLSRIRSIIGGMLKLNKPVVMGEFGFSNSTALNADARSKEGSVDYYIHSMKSYMDAAFMSGCSGVMFWGWGVSQEKDIPMWWAGESHSKEDGKFSEFIQSYRIPKGE